MTTKSTDPMSYAITWSYVVVDDFLPIELANAMRAEIEAHFGDPDHHQPKTHQIWNYWYVPGAYTYLRTAPENVIERTRVEAFAERLKKWSIHEFGIGNATWPYLSLYTNGCSQTLHNDSLNGRFGYVYSLTKLERKTIGGETIIVSDGDPFRQNLRRSTALGGFSNAIEPKFNRLVVFDDRVIHGVERVAGSMDPVEGRFVLHGHIKDKGPIVTGALSIEQVEPLFQAAQEKFFRDNGAEVARFTGLLTFKIEIGPDGVLSELFVYLDRVTHLSHDHASAWPPLRDRLVAALSGLRFPAAPERTGVMLPIVFNGQ